MFFLFNTNIPIPISPNAPTRSLNLRHEPAALLCRFDWLHLGIVHTKYALCSRFAQSLPRIDTLSFSEELLTSNNKSPSQEGDLGGG